MSYQPGRTNPEDQFRPGSPMSARKFERIRRGVNAIFRSSATRAFSGPSGIHQANSVHDAIDLSSITTIRAFEIVSYTANGDSQDSNSKPTQWHYTVASVAKTAPGYGKWANDDFYSGLGYNWLEDSNELIALEGNPPASPGEAFAPVAQFQNGVNHDGDDYPPGWKIQPLKQFSIHPGVILDVPSAIGSTVLIKECWLMPYTGEDGTCEAT